MSPKPDTHFVRACAVETHVKISQEPLHTEIYRENAAPQIEPGMQTHILCEPVSSETHVKISQEPLSTEIYRINAEAQSEHPDQAPAFTPTISCHKKPSVWTHCLGKKLEDLVSWETF